MRQLCHLLVCWCYGLSCLLVDVATFVAFWLGESSDVLVDCVVLWVGLWSACV